MLRIAARSLLAFFVLASYACGEDPPTTTDMDGGISGADAGPPMDGGPIVRADTGPIMVGDAGPCDGPRDLGEVIPGLVENTWTFVGFDQPGQEAFCMDGSTTGIGINLGSDPRVVIYLEGGGACFDTISCAGVTGQDGFDGADLGRFSGSLDNYGIFNRGSEDNPMRTWTYVYVPYCTGDTHAGTNPDGFGGRQHVGYTNMQRYLRRLVPTFSASEMVLLTGSSAGGLGALANYDQTQTMFGCVPVHMLDDSGPPMATDYLRSCLQEQTIALWGVVTPPDCPQCTDPALGGLVSIWSYVGAKYPDRQFGLLSTMEDMTIRQFYGYGYSPRCNFPQVMSGADYTAGLEDIRDRVMAPYDNMRTFYRPGTGHTFLGRGLGGPMAGGVSLGAWIQQLLDDDPEWSHVGP